ncbi:DUF4126 domain-containing protein [soil metagenome]
MTNTLTGILLAASAGLNAFIPLLGLALADRASTSIDLSRPYNVISSTAGIVILLFLLTIDLIVDKVPRLDHLNDLVSTALRPASGMFLVMVVTDGKGEIDEVVAMMTGLLVAGAVHAYKAISRIRMATQSTGAGNPLVSLVEDALSAMATLLALTLPWVGAAFLGIGGYSLAWFYRVVPNSFGGRGPTAAAPSASAGPSSDPSLNRDIEENSRV